MAVTTPDAPAATDAPQPIDSSACADRVQAAGAANDCTTDVTADSSQPASDLSAPTATSASLAPNAPASSPSPTAPVGSAALSEYVVQPGDSLRSIAEKFKLTNETLIWANDLANPDLLRSGIELTIPPVDGVVHHVQPGDTVANVTWYYGADVADVIDANALKAPYVIATGDLLLIPGGRMPMPEPPPVLAPAASPDSTAVPAEQAPDTVEIPPDQAPVQAAEAEPAKPLPIPPSATESQAAFILSIVDASRASESASGVPTSVTIAQAILESYWGSSRLSREANNYFGIKAKQRGGSAGVVWFNTWEHSGGYDVMQNEPFRAYVTIEDSFVDHGVFFIENGRYATAMEHVGDPREFARQIASAGYATDPAYSAKLIGLMDRFNLYAYDLSAEE